MPRIQERVFLKPRVEEFLAFCGARNLSANTIRAYRANLVEFVALSGGSKVSIAEVNRKLLRRFAVVLSEANGKPATLRRKMAAVQSFCKWLDGEELLDAGPIGSIPGPRRRDELPDVPSESDVKRLLDGAMPTD